MTIALILYVLALVAGIGYGIVAERREKYINWRKP